MADMLDPKQPVIRRLIKRGFKVAAQAHLLDQNSVIVTYIAWHPKTKRKFQSWSRTGDPAEAPPSSLGEFKDVEKIKILEALELHNWNRVRAAKALGMARRTFYRRLKEYEIL